MLHYGMGQGEALDTRIDVAEMLLRFVRDEEDASLLGLAMAYHNPKALQEAVEKRSKRPTEEGAGEPKAADPLAFAAGLAKLARLKPGDPKKNAAMAADILLKAKASSFLANRKKGASGSKR